MGEPLATVEVPARRWWVDSGLDVTPGEVLGFAASGTWWDAGYETGPEGRDIDSIRRLRRLRRVRGADWGALIGVVGRFGETFVIGAGTTHLFASRGRLRLYFNDVFGFYRNNQGAVSLRIWRG